MTIPMDERRYFDFERIFDWETLGCVLANWDACPSCQCRGSPEQMRAFEYHGGIFFESTCSICGEVNLCAYETVIG